MPGTVFLNSVYSSSFFCNRESGVVNKRSVSLEARSRNSRSGPREASLDRMSKTRQEFLLLSQVGIQSFSCFNDFRYLIIFLL